jgi:hypothetical protein
MGRLKRVNSLHAAVALSLVMHAALLFGTSRVKKAEIALSSWSVPSSLSVRVKVVQREVVVKSERSSVAPVSRKVERVPELAPEVSIQEQPSVAKVTESAEPAATTAELANSKPTGGVSFLPSTGSLTRLLPGAETQGRWQAEGFAQSSEGHRESGDAAARMVEGSNLNSFMDHFDEHFRVPAPLRRYAVLGHAEAEVARFSEQQESTPSWRVWSLRGEPYFRAVLFESLQAFLPTQAARESLRDFPESRFVVALDYEKERADTLRTMEQSSRFFGARLTITLRDFEVSDAWLVPSVSADEKGRPFAGLNVVGTLLYLKNRMAPPDWLATPEMQSLRASPGFSLQGNIGSLLPVPTVVK